MVSYSALKAVCSAGDDVARQRMALKKLFGSFVKCDKNVVRTQVAALVSRLEKNAPVVNPGRPVSPPPSKNPERAPEPIREALIAHKAAVESQAADDASRAPTPTLTPSTSLSASTSSSSSADGCVIPAVPEGCVIGGGSLTRNASMHLGGSMRGGAGGRQAMVGTLPSAKLSHDSLDRMLDVDVGVGLDVEAVSVSGDGSESSPIRAEPGDKCARDTLADETASEEIFGKAFRGGPEAATRLAARLQREVGFYIYIYIFFCDMLPCYYQGFSMGRVRPRGSGLSRV